MSQVEAEYEVRQTDERVDAPEPPQPSQPAGNSLSDRMAARAEYLAQHQTEKFTIPGYEGVLEVELRLLGYKTIRKTIARNEKIRDTGERELISMADQIVRATVGFFEVDGEERRPIEDSWMTLANRMPLAPDEMTPRKAIMFLVGDRLHFLVEDFADWARTVRPEVDEEVMSDFGPTG